MARGTGHSTRIRVDDPDLLERLVELSWRADVLALLNSARSEAELGEGLAPELRRACDAELAFVVGDGGAPRGSGGAAATGDDAAAAIAGAAGLPPGGAERLARDPDVLAALDADAPLHLAAAPALGGLARHALLVPLGARAGAPALVGVARTSDRPFTARDLERLEALAADVGPAVGRLRAGAERERRAAEDRALVRAARSLASSLEPDHVHATLCAEVAAALGAESVVLWLGDAGGGLRAAAAHGRAADVAGERRAPGEGPEGAALRTGRPQAGTGAAAPPAAGAERPAAPPRPRTLAVPLRRGGEHAAPDGVLAAGFAAGSPVGAREVELLEAFADLGGPALRNAEAYAAARRAASVDSLTGCLNRAAFDARLREEIARAEREHGGFTLALIDLDDFKSINERHGHLAGDTVLRTVGELLRGAVRPYDVAARVGGDEFALLLAGTDAAAASVVVGRALGELRRAPIPGGGELGAAAGVAAWRPGEQPTTLIERADHELLAAKDRPSHPTRRSEPAASRPSEREPRSDPAPAPAAAAVPVRLAEAVAIGAKLTRLLDPRAIAQTTVDELHEELGYERCVMVRLSAGDGVTAVAAAPRGGGASPEPWRRPQDEGAVGRCLRERRPVLVDDATRDPLRRERVAPGMHAQLAVPLFVGTELWGALDLQAAAPGALGPEDAQLVATVAEHVGAALRTAYLLSQLEQAYQGTAEALAAALEAKDDYTADHARSIADLAVEVGRELGLDADDLRDVRYGAIFHDIGKIAVPDAILNKPGTLSDAEFEVIKRHPVAGEQILAPVPFLANVRRIVRHDHERWDGSGYPDGLRGPQIPIGARIVSVVDAFHAMTSDRPYRAGMGTDAALAELRAAAGTQFDPAVVEALITVLARR